MQLSTLCYYKINNAAVHIMLPDTNDATAHFMLPNYHSAAHHFILPKKCNNTAGHFLQSRSKGKKCSCCHRVSIVFDRFADITKSGSTGPHRRIWGEFFVWTACRWFLYETRAWWGFHGPGSCAHQTRRLASSSHPASYCSHKSERRYSINTSTLNIIFFYLFLFHIFGGNSRESTKLNEKVCTLLIFERQTRQTRGKDDVVICLKHHLLTRCLWHYCSLW